VLVSWISAQFLVGSQLCWLLRPFFGEPHQRVTFFADDVLHGSFFDAVLLLMRSTFGAAAPVVFALVAGGSAVLLVDMLRGAPEEVSVEVGSAGLAVNGGSGRVVTWREIARVRPEGARVTIELVTDEALGRETLRVGCASGEAAAELARRIGEESARVRVGAFRTAG
jgi:hypothetical protein